MPEIEQIQAHDYLSITLYTRLPMKPNTSMAVGLTINCRVPVSFLLLKGMEVLDHDILSFQIEHQIIQTKKRSVDVDEML